MKDDFGGSFHRAPGYVEMSQFNLNLSCQFLINGTFTGIVAGTISTVLAAAMASLYDSSQWHTTSYCVSFVASGSHLCSSNHFSFLSGHIAIWQHMVVTTTVPIAKLTNHNMVNFVFIIH